MSLRSNNVTCPKQENEILHLKGILTHSRNDLRVIELFAGAGGMGLGFLMAGNQKIGYRIIFSSEINPVYLRSLEKNYKFFDSNFSHKLTNCIPAEYSPIDLSKKYSLELMQQISKDEDGVDVVIGGTPCQGFSSSNRRGWNSKYYHNQLVENFVQIAIDLSPKVILLENVQGILWTPRYNSSKSKKVNVVDHIYKQLTQAGYILFPNVLNAAWYGVPQNRNRFFLLALHQDLGYRINDFSEWGPFPIPTHNISGGNRYVTVRDAISDLPSISNGESRSSQEYTELTAEELKSNPFLEQMRSMSPKGIIEGHIVSKQADYVIERYRHIPQGGNWQDIRHMMTNYSNVHNTHSNIYRRLKWDEPSITIGNYRKSMIVHPEQHRGLSLREASRLQSLPDWFTFCGTVDESKSGGLMHKQQQLANAVSFLMTLKIARYILKL